MSGVRRFGLCRPIFGGGSAIAEVLCRPPSDHRNSQDAASSETTARRQLTVHGGGER